MQPWEHIAVTEAKDGTRLELRKRGPEYLILAGGHDLMSSEDEGSSRALADLGCSHIAEKKRSRILIGGLGMGYTLRAALDCVSSTAIVEIAELVAAVAQWNREILGSLASHPLDDLRVRLHIGDVGARIRAAKSRYDAILLDVDNGPSALAHAQNQSLYSRNGLAASFAALRPGGVLGVWSFGDDRRFTRSLKRQGFSVAVHRVPGSRKGRGRYHVIWVARRLTDPTNRSSC